MAKEKTLYKNEETKSRDEAANFLHGLAEQIAAGKLVLGEGKEEQILGVGEELILEIQAEGKKKKGKRKSYALEIEIQWSEVKAGKQQAPESEGAENEDAEQEVAESEAAG
jgi:amphi-Trp domain-containing protein